MTIPIMVLLSITHERLLTSFSEIHAAMEDITGRGIQVPEIPRTLDLVKARILEQHPGLCKWNAHTEDVTIQNISVYHQLAKAMFGDDLEIDKIED